MWYSNMNNALFGLQLSRRRGAVRDRLADYEDQIILGIYAGTVTYHTYRNHREGR